MGEIQIRPVEEGDREWMAQFIRQRWGSNRMAAHGNLYFPHTLPGFIAQDGEEKVGLLTYHMDGAQCEVVTLDSASEGRGVGSRLIQAARRAALDAGCRRLWLITTNDNVHALRFYQKQGFELVAVHRNAVAQARQLKPEIPLVGNDGIPIRDEIELEMALE
ncbi:MAG TPA: GNAT family N-acetyltransferase [Candidatus Sulfomarinibacteraceae bacterium]|nr:GNAT family N-acetyltransferase [Candidatus Sulfomarinibacteraceae bacterium]